MPLEVGDTGIRDENFNLGDDTLYIFTDGVTEGSLKDGNCLGVEGFQDIVGKHADLHAYERIGAVVSILKDTGRKRHDDITILAIQRTSLCLEQENKHNGP